MIDNTVGKVRQATFHNIESRVTYSQINQTVNDLGESVGSSDYYDLSTACTPARMKINRRREIIDLPLCDYTDRCLRQAETAICNCPLAVRCRDAKKFLLDEAS